MTLDSFLADLFGKHVTVYNMNTLLYNSLHTGYRVKSREFLKGLSSIGWPGLFCAKHYGMN